MHKNYLIIAGAFSRCFVLMGVSSTSSNALSEAMKDFCAQRRPELDFTIDGAQEIHCGAGSHFLSNKFIRLCRNRGINATSAAPDHQEMSGLPERPWQAARLAASRMMAAARPLLIFFHFALMCAWQMCVILPAKSTSRLDEEGNLVPAAPCCLRHGEIPGARRCRVLGCPAIARVARRRNKDGKALDSSNVAQRGARRIFAGFPERQAGWGICIPASRRALPPAGASFAEGFESTLLLLDTLHHDSLMVRKNHQPIDRSDPTAFAGPPSCTRDAAPGGAKWAPLTAGEPDCDADTLRDDEARAVDIFKSAPEQAIHEARPSEDPPPLEATASAKKGIDPEKQAALAHHLRMKITAMNTLKDPPFLTEESMIAGDSIDAEKGAAMEDCDFERGAAMSDAPPEDTPEELKSPPPAR